MIRVEVNGQMQELPDHHELLALLAQRMLRPPFAVEVNQQLVRRNQYDRVILRDGDRVEIVTLVGGG